MSANPNTIVSSVPNWVTTSELAARWRMTTRTLERWRAEPYGPAWHHIGGKVLYLLDDILAYEGRHRRTVG